MRSKAWVLPLLTTLLLLPTESAYATCKQSGASLGCFDASPIQGPAEPSTFRWFGEGKVLPPSSLAFGLMYHFSHKPLEVVSPSSAPSGRVIDIVSQSHRLEFRGAIGLGRGIDLSLALPIGIRQTGAGSEALSTRDSETIANSGLGDMRVGLRTQLPKVFSPLDWTLRLEMTLPTGNERLYLGEPSATETIATNLSFSLGPVIIATDLGAKVSKQRRFADTLIGPQLLCGLGLGFRLLPKDSLTVAVEALVRPMLSNEPTLAAADGEKATIRATSVIPAEWMANISTRPSELPVWFSLGAGTAIALSRRDTGETESPRVNEHFVAPTSARFKLESSISVRY